MINFETPKRQHLNPKKYIRKHKYSFSAALIFLIWFYFALPNPLFDKPTSTLLFSQNNELLGAQIATDGQWYFPLNDSIPNKFKQCVVNFEDAYFYKHPGVNPISLTKALWQDIKAGKIVRGGSTITMQVMRMARGNRSRNVYQKFMEILLALRLELSYSKDKILNMYVSNAPFGGNVVGLEAASWRYYGRSPDKLSWGESATLAVLPNAPSLIYPGKNHKILLAKRNRLLDKLRAEKIIDSTTCELAKSEELPGKPKVLPQLTPHLLQRAIKEGLAGKRIYTSIDRNLQTSVQNIGERHHNYLSANKIYNMGIIVMRVTDGKVISYIGNVKNNEKDKGDFMDMIMAPRSTGSVIKPYLYAWAMKDGLILPHTLLKDVPTQIAGYNPKNYNKAYDGMVPAGDALARSLNIPAVRLLRKYGLKKFLDNLKNLQLSTITYDADHYGLTLILGGAETKLNEIAGVYAGMARSLNTYNNGGQYYKETYFMPEYLKSKKHELRTPIENPIFGAGNTWLVFDALSAKDRPVEGGDWNIYQSAQRIAWKTGTSFGYRDAWCVGITPEYVVGVWVGNATGEGRPGLTGTQSAAPVMFDVFKRLPHSTWFEKPLEALREAEICTQSGMLAGIYCDKTHTENIPVNGERTEVCQYHQSIHLDKEGKYRVNSACYNVSDMQNKSWFVLPPVAAWYYRKNHPEYKKLPPWHSSCQTNDRDRMALIYPKPGAKIFLPKDFNNIQQKVVFKAAHQNPNTLIYWHLDKQYIGTTKTKHQIEIFAPPGKHTLTLISQNGGIISCNFEVVK